MLPIWHWPQGIIFTVTERILIRKKESFNWRSWRWWCFLRNRASFKIQILSSDMIFLRFFKAKISRKTSKKPEGFDDANCSFTIFVGKKIGSNVHFNSGTKKKEVKSVEISWEMLKSLFDFHAISMTRIFILFKLFSKCEKYVLFVQDRGLFSIAASPRKK